MRHYTHYPTYGTVTKLQEPDVGQQLQAAKTLRSIGRYAGAGASLELLRLLKTTEDETLAEAALDAFFQIEGIPPTDEVATGMRTLRKANLDMTRRVHRCTSAREAGAILREFFSRNTHDLILDSRAGGVSENMAACVSHLIRRFPSQFPIVYRAFVNQAEDREWIGDAIAALAPDYPPAQKALGYALGEADNEVRSSALMAALKWGAHVFGRLKSVVPDGILDDLAARAQELANNRKSC